jgi:tRNA pseudouridine65 synthase
MHRRGQAGGVRSQQWRSELSEPTRPTAACSSCRKPALRVRVRSFSFVQNASPLLSVLYQDDHYVAVNKPAGLLVHRTRIDRGETRLALQMVRNQVGSRVYPVHRLDKPTSGAMVFARSPAAAEALAAQFRAHAVEKRYLVIVRGYMPESGRIDHALRSENGKRQDAVTAYRRLETAEVPHAVGRYPTARYSLVLAWPETGRTHQIRRHMKHMSHPIIGDRKYGDDRHTRFVATKFDCDRLLLHALELRFMHPFAGHGVSVAAPLDEKFGAVVKQLGWDRVLPAGR